MRVFITYGGSNRWAVDVTPEATVAEIKDIIRSRAFFDTIDNKREGKFLDLLYGGMPAYIGF